MSGNLSVWSLILEAGLVVQIVLVILMLLSLFSWAIIFSKWRLFGKAKAADDTFDVLFWDGSSLEDVAGKAKDMHESAQAAVFLKGYQTYNKIRQERKGNTLNIRHALDQAWTGQMRKFAAGLAFLATVGSTAPFIGLFGTVWGIIDAFQNIGLTQNTSLATVAPGIAEALVATAFGLLAAIPAVIAYNAFSSKMKDLNNDLDGFSTEFMSVLTQHVKKQNE